MMWICFLGPVVLQHGGFFFLLFLRQFVCIYYFGCPGAGDGLKRFCPQADGEAEDANGFELVAEVDQVFVF